MSQATYQPEERARQYRLLSEQAIKQALNSQWEEAVESNRRLLELAPRDVSGLNRLGKALSELGQYDEARQVYTEALEVDPENNIAKKNLDRLAQLQPSAAPKRPVSERIDPRLFIEETGKTGFTNLLDLAPAAVTTRLAAGDQVYLQREGAVLYVSDATGERIGRVEPMLAGRLTRLMDGGNQYAAGIAELNDREVRIIIREIFQHPSQFGRVSFPAQQGVGETIRPYTKESILRYEEAEEDEEAEEGEYEEAEDEEMEAGHETELEEEGFAISDE